MKPIYVLLVLALAALACAGPGQLTAAPATIAPPTEAPATTAPNLEMTSAPTEAPAAEPTATEAAGNENFVGADTPLAAALAELKSHTGRIEKDITYCTAGGVALKMDLYFPKEARGPTPVAVHIHGGGRSRGDKLAPELVLDGPGLLDAGITVASLNYRLAPDYQFPAMIEDVKCAIRSLRAHASDYHIDPDHIGVWGTSAGGHLVNMLGTTDSSAGFDVGEYLEQTSRVQVVVDMFGPADLTTMFTPAFREVNGPVFADYDKVKASPITYVSGDDPPFLILHGDADPVVPLAQSQLFYDQLTSVGVETSFTIVQGGNHGFSKPNSTPSRPEISQMIVAFLVDHLQ